MATPLQIAVGEALGVANEIDYFATLRADYLKRRELLCGVLESAGLPYVRPQGSFFVLADITSIDEKYYIDPNEKEVAKDWQFCRWMTKEIGVGAIPITAFCRHSSRAQLEKYVRFAFCKGEDAIEEAGKRLLKLREFQKK